MKAVSRPADNTKTIGLVVAVIVVFVFVVWRTVSALGGAAPPDPAGAEVKLDGPGTPGPVVANADADVDVPIYDAVKAPNPFHADDIDGTFRSITDFSRRKAALKRAQDTGRAVTDLPKEDKGDKQVIPTVVPVAPDPVPMVVNGVVLGINPVVVLTVGDKQFVVDRGARFGNGMRVSSITSSQVVVDDGKERHYLKVGGRPEPVAPVKPASPLLQKAPTQVLPNGSF